MWTRVVSAALFAASLASGSALDVERRDTFTSCLQNSGSGGSITVPSSSNYDTSRAAFNQRLSYKPAAIAYPKSASDVQKYVKCAAASNIPVVSRSGGHSYAAYGVGGQDGALVVDLKNMKSLTVDSSGVAKVQTGNLLGDLAQKLWDNGQRALPHGTCPYVGSGGHTAFGGYGPFSRVGGLLHDRVTAAEVVLANGTLTTASASVNADLFWALRGAGASYGVVTQWTFATFAAPPTVIGYSIDYSGGLSGSKIASLLNAWQTLAINAPKEMAMIGVVGPDGDGGLYLQFTGDYYGTKSAFNSVTANWASKLSPGKITAKTYNWYDSLVATDGPLSTTNAEPKDTFFAKSLFTKTAVTSSQWTSFLNYLVSKGANSDTDWFVEIDLYGGQIKTLAADSTSFAHRDAILSFQLYASSKNYKPPYPSDGISFVNGMLNALDPNPQAAYVNYVDPTLTSSQWKNQYYGSHYSRLSSIKRSVDPNNVFRFPQSIGLS
ncbi:FAD-binding domain protein [Ceratobasidium sp. AG-Ba]|nr:FAD-binding domain protein [Ceratobasidium sp. AG-Ba]QRW15212.1 FAD-binding domain protein [Ceratobasidium sp. AG-Ba]